MVIMVVARTEEDLESLFCSSHFFCVFLLPGHQRLHVHILNLFFFYDRNMLLINRKLPLQPAFLL